MFIFLFNQSYIDSSFHFTIRTFLLNLRRFPIREGLRSYKCQLFEFLMTTLWLCLLPSNNLGKIVYDSPKLYY